MIKKLFFGICISILLLICSTGCGHKLSSERDVNKYLKENFPDETFTILDTTTRKAYDPGGCDEDGEEPDEQVWTVKSIQSNVEFQVSEMYSYNGFVCYFTTTDNYLDKILENFVSQENNYKMTYSRSGLNFKLEHFSNKEELAQFIYNEVTKLNGDKYFSKYYDKKTFIYVYIYDHNEIKYSINIANISGISSILDKMV